MTRTLTPTLLAAQNQESYEFLTKLEIYPTRVFIDNFILNTPFAGSDGQGIVDDPVKQEIVHNGSILVTYFCDGLLKYVPQGSSTPVSTGISSSVKPGIFGNRIYVYTGTTIKRYSINWGTYALTEEASMTPSVAPVALHGVSATECVAILNDDGGFRPAYISGTTEYASATRFMFPKFVEWSGSARSMSSLGVFSGGAKLGTKVFAYISNAATGVVEGTMWDPDTASWSDTFVALPTDSQVSLCEFRIANVYTLNNFVYMCGQFNRTDIYGTAKVYSLILRSEDGKTFSIDNFTLVSDLNYRFLSAVGNGALYISSCSRSSWTSLTWYFNGDNSDNAAYQLDVSEDQILSISDTDANQLTVSLANADESFDETWPAQYSLVKFYAGFRTTVGAEYVLYGTYIMGAPRVSYKDGGRALSFAATSQATAKLTGLSMPFYAEILGLSSIYDPMNKVSGKLYAAPNMTRSAPSFQVDFWQHKGYINAANGITAPTTGGGPPEFNMTGSHKKGIIMKEDLQEILGITAFPKITATSITVKIYGWSRPNASAQPNDKINLIVIHSDKDGNNEQTLITTSANYWKITYPYTLAGSEPITITLTGLTVDRYIKNVGLVMEAPNSTLTCPARIEFTNNVEVPIPIQQGDIPWTVDTDGTFKVPGSGLPFVMFAQRPYNTPNFVLAAKFTNDVTGNITGYPVAAGLVGLAEDASNCIVARYNQTDNLVELIKIRNGISTVLGSATPAWSVGASQELQFKHRDGKFDIYLYRDSTAQFELVLGYSWKASDGFMYTSLTATMKCGIYGLISAPLARILSFSKYDTENAGGGDGMPVDPLSSVTGFPSSGRLRIGENVYSYTGKISHPTICRGPYQLRNVGIYQAPYGNGHAGVETRDFDWNQAAGLTSGKLIAVDNGLSFISIGDLWRVFIKTGGVKIWLPSRSRYYTANAIISDASRFSTNNRVWIVGGFTGVGLYSGQPLRHSVGEWAMLELDGEIHCHWFMGAGGETDTTVEDLIDSIARLSGARANFPGDHTVASQVISGETSIFQDDYAEGFAMSFETASPASFEIRANVKITPTNYEEVTAITNDTDVALKVDSLGSGSYALSLVSRPSNTVMFKMNYTSGTARQKFRVLFYGDSISLHQNNKWVMTITTDELIYTQTNYIAVKGYSAGTITFENIRIQDLGDWREAVYIDLETDGNSAIGSVVQERPIEMVSQSDGSMSFYYEFTRSIISLAVAPQQHEFFIEDPTEAGSDAIIYGAGKVQTIQYRGFAATKGLATKLIRIPSLDIGSLEAAQRILDRLYESRGNHSINMRPNLEIQCADQLDFGYTLTGTGTVKAFSTIVSSVSLAVQMSKTKTVSMKLMARNTL